MSGVGKLVDRAARAGEVKAKADVRALRAEVRRLERDVLAANKRAEVVDGLRAGARRPRPLKYTKNLHRRVATPVLLCSDWHVGELVRADKVNGVNSYTQHEARHRGNRLAEALLWLVEHHRNSFEIRELVVWLGGDLITGYLHPDQHLAPEPGGSPGPRHGQQPPGLSPVLAGNRAGHLALLVR
jgi:hypothetical protein